MVSEKFGPRFVNINKKKVLNNWINDEITQFTGLDNITYVGSNLSIIKNESLEDLDDLSDLRSIGRDLTIEENDTLDDVTGLHSVESVGRNLTIEKNDSLKTSSANALRDAIGSSNIGGKITISGNKP